MPFLFTCPHCDFSSRIANHFAGDSGPCVNCGKSVLILQPQFEGSVDPDVKTSNATGLALLLILGGLVFFATVGGLIYVVVVPQVARQRQNAVHQRTRLRLAKIGQALQMYSQSHGSYPPAITYDAAGKPMHSWRVLILPELGYPELHARYDFTQPWDSPVNSAIGYEMPVEYASATDPTARSQNESSFYVITGKGSAFPDSGTTRLEDIRDGTRDTVLVAETPAYGFSWLEPRDIRLARLESRVNGSPGQSFASESPLGPQVLTADGEVRTLRFDAPAEAIPALATIDGGEAINWNAVATD
jgi:type II secretory pathway pseudopilin PulG